MRQQYAILSHHVLYNTEHGPDQDEEAGRVEHKEVLLPRDLQILGDVSWNTTDTQMEDSRDDYEEGEEEDLNGQSGCNDMVSQLDSIVVFRFRKKTTTYPFISSQNIQDSSKGSVPADCARKERTSPITNVVVSHLTLIRECDSPSVNLMIRARTMYIEAAKRAGANKIRRLCIV